jgi:hypothetical protein
MLRTSSRFNAVVLASSLLAAACGSDDTARTYFASSTGGAGGAAGQGGAGAGGQPAAGPGGAGGSFLGGPGGAAGAPAAGPGGAAGSFPGGSSGAAGSGDPAGGTAGGAGASTAGSAGAAGAENGGASGAGPAAGAAGQSGAGAGGAGGSGGAGGAGGAGGGAGGGVGGSGGGVGGTGGAGGGVGGSGGSVAAECVNDFDCPGTDTSCHHRVCDAGKCLTADQAQGAPCFEGGGVVCDGNGTCVECNAGADCSSGQCAAHACVPVSACAGDDHLLISQIRTHGEGGPGDEFVELFNPTGSPIVLDATWEIRSRAVGSPGYNKRWGGNGQVIAPGGYFLLGGSGYVQLPAADALLQSGVKDASSVVLAQSNATVDALCFFYDVATLSGYDPTYICEGVPISNEPHNDNIGSSTNVDLSMVRTGGSGCLDTDDSTTDFASLAPADPRSSTSP